MEHISVLQEETIDLLNVHDGGIYVDCTLGRGGHAKKLLERGSNIHLYAFDKDVTAIEESKENLNAYLSQITFIHDDFCHIKEILNEYGVTEVDGVMMDLGVSSPQIDDPQRGFSYRYDAPLDMRMDQTQTLTAYEIVNRYPYEKLAYILSAYGEERYAKQIARKIEKMRVENPIETTFQLVDVIKHSLPAKELNKKGHPAKQTFQALRIEVNNELTSLSAGLQEACKMLKPKGRCAIISFHSLEDRIVKNLFKDLTTAPFALPKLPLTASQMEQASFSLVTKKPIVASSEELDKNHRAHSAKLRVIERIK